MKTYFWDGSEFRGKSVPCFELHFLGNRYKLFVIGKHRVTWFYKERL